MNHTTEPMRLGLELRAEVTGNKLEGHAAVFGQYAELPGHLEALERSAFDAVSRDAATDVRALYEHDRSKLLGRQSSGTLRWSVDSQGLPFEVDLPNTTTGRDVRELALRGDLSGASIGFLPGEDKWDYLDGRQVRTHTSVSRLFDLSVVAFPAYTGTSVALRSLADIGTTSVTPTRPGGIESQRSQLIRIRHRMRLGRV